MTGWLDQPLLDLDGLDLDSPDHVTYLLHQRFRYDYDAPAYDVRQRLVAVPRPRHGGLHRREQHVAVGHPDRPGQALPGARRTTRTDRAGNVVVHVSLPVVPESVEFTLAALVQRVGPPGDALLPIDALGDPLHTRYTDLTRPDAALRGLAAELRAATADDTEFADACCARLRAELGFAFDATSVATTAAEAWAIRRGVCQDFAHVMLAVCRVAGLPGRYVSGHLLGEQGGSHAWTEVLVRDSGPAGPYVRAIGLDPTNGCRAGSRHLPVAVGRDYLDVAPTSGVFSGTATGQLTWSKRAGVTAVGRPVEHALALD